MKSSMVALVCSVASILLLAQTENSSCEDLDMGSTFLYKDVFSGDILFTGKYKKKLLDDVMYEVYGNWVTKRQGDIVENASDLSAEEADELVTVVDVIHDHRLRAVDAEKEHYQASLKEYMDKVVARLEEQSPDQVDVFQSNVNNVMRDFLQRFKDFKVYTGKSMDTDAMLVLVEYKDVDGVNIPVLYFFKHGLVEINTCEDLDTGNRTLYKDFISGDVMFSGKYKKKLIDCVMYEVHGKVLTARLGDIQEPGVYLAPGEADEIVTYVDIIPDHNLQEVGFQKTSYLAYLKDYMINVEAILQKQSPDQVDTFKSNVNNVIRDLMHRFHDFTFFRGESLNPDGMVALMEYTHIDGVKTPVLYFLKHGLVEENT